MLTRRRMIAGLAGLATAPMIGCTSRPRSTALPAATAGRDGLPPLAPAIANADGRLDAVIDISHWTTVSDFNLARTRSNILGVVHKASEGGDWRDPMYADRRAQAEAAGLLWGAYHYGTHQYSGADQAAWFLATARPGPTTLMALDLEFNEDNPSNTMRLHQAEDFVRTVLAATGRFPLVYTNPSWAEGKPMGRGRHSLGVISGRSILANCHLWLADYRAEPQTPSAWTGKGWRFWQYAGDTTQGGLRVAKVRDVSGVDRCDRNLFPGDVAQLFRFWKEEAGRQFTS